jgi:hypothetical protein
MKIQCKHYKDYPNSLRKLYQKGGKYKKAVEKSNHIEKIFQYDFCNLRKLNKTKKGESRIKKCIKYELSGNCRLVTIQDRGIILFCFAGTHSCTDRWIDRHRGLTLTNNKGKIGLIQKSENIRCHKSRITGDSSFSIGPLYKKIPEKYFNYLIEDIDNHTSIKISQIESTYSEEDIICIAKGIDNKERSQLVYDVFCLLRQNKIEMSIERIQLFLGETQELKELNDAEIIKLINNDEIKNLAIDDPHYARVFNYYIRTTSYMDWMLFLNTEQEKLVNKDFSGTAKLLGVSGSGKTCIVVRRAIRLAEKYTNQNILIITLNKSLAQLINNLVDYAALPEIREQIEVKAFFEICQSYLYQFEPNNRKIYDDKTWKSEEHIDAIWREYYRCELNNNDASVLLPVHDYLISKSINAEAYIREEFDWIRSAVTKDKRQKYLHLERRGRSYRLEKKYRAYLLKGLSYWEKKMTAIGVTDYLGISSALTPYLQKIKSPYRCILVDESQDFGTTELAVIRKLVRKNKNDIFFSGDAAQKVSCKHQSFVKARICMHGSRTHKILKNYRNSKEILEFANDVLSNNSKDTHIIENDEFKILKPEYADRYGSPPLVLKSDSLKNEISSAYQYMLDVIEDNFDKKGCIAFCGYSLYEVEQYAKQYNIPILNGELCITKHNIYFSDLEQTKGFEFDYMCIVNCNAGVIPDILKPKEEQLTDLARLYVAMTRAKTELIVSFSEILSSYITNSTDYYLEGDWKEYSPPNKIFFKDIQHFDDNKYNDLSLMTAASFLYKKEALGLSNSFIKNLRNTVQGYSKQKNNLPTKWENLSNLILDCKKYPKINKKFGKDINLLEQIIHKY